MDPLSSDNSTNGKLMQEHVGVHLTATKSVRNDDNNMVHAYNELASDKQVTSDSEQDNWSEEENKNFLKTPPKVIINRPAFDQTNFNERFQFEYPKNRNLVRILRKVLQFFLRFNYLGFFIGMFPILRWFFRYQWRKDLVPDFSAGFTVAVMHIPQGMAYAILASVDPIIGIYTAFFPVIIYVLMGTSKHISLGTFAIVSILISKTVHNFASFSDDSFQSTSTVALDILNQRHGNYTPTQVITAVTFMTGIFQLIFYVLRLGVMCSLLSHALIRGFTTGAAIHVFSSQVKYLLGLKLPSFNKPLALFEFYSALIGAIHNTNLVTLGLSLSVILFLECYVWIFEQKLAICLRGISFPIHLLVVILGVIVSWTLDLNSNYDVVVVGNIQTGLPSPVAPPKELFLNVALDAFIIAIVSYVVTYSLGVLFANKHKYKISASQELLAQGASNIFGSFFQSLPISGSLSRTSVQDGAGCKTLMTSAFSVFFLLWVLLFAGPIFKPLPNAVLSAIIVHALKGMFKQFLDIKSFISTKSYTDLLVWIISFWSTVILGVDMGLLVGVLTNVSMLLKWSLNPKLQVLSETDFRDLNVDPKYYHDVKETGNLVIVRIVGSLNFSNAAKNLEEIESILDNREKEFDVKMPKYFILDLYGVPMMDLSACLSVMALHKNFRSRGIKVAFACISGLLWERFESCGVFDEIRKHQCFPSLQDALAILGHGGNMKII